MLLRAFAVLLALALPAAAQSVLTVGASGDFPDAQAAIDAAAPGDIVLLLESAQTSVLIDKGIALVGLGQTLVKPDSGPGSGQPTIRIAGVPAGQSVLVSGVSVFLFGDGVSAAIEVADCDGPVWFQDVFVDAYGAQALSAHDASSLVLVEAALQTNLVAALPDGTPQSAPGARLSGETHAFLHDAHVFGSHGTLQFPGLPVPTAAPDGGAGLHVTDAQVKVAGTQVSGGSGNSFFNGSCSFAGDGGAGVLTLDGPAPGLPAVTLRSAAVSGGSGGFATCGPAPVPGPAFDAVPGTVTSQAVLLRRFDVAGVVEPGQPITLAFDGAAGDVVLLFGSASAAPAATFGAIDLHLAVGSLFPVAVFALAGASLDVPAVVPALPAGIDGVIVPLQAVFVDVLGAKHGSEPRAVVIH